MNFILPIKMAISHQNNTELQYCTGMSRREIKKIKLKKFSFMFFSIFKKLGGEGL